MLRIAQVYYLVLTHFRDCRAEWFIFSGILSGGFTTFLTGIFTYIADVTR